MRKPRKTLTALAVFLACAAGQANELIRPVHPEDLPGGTKVGELNRVKGARIAYADYAALIRDFPKLTKLAPNFPTITLAERKTLDEWILANFALMSPAQKRLEGIRNTEIPLDAQAPRVGYRPVGYGRAAVVEGELAGEKIGLIDLKGVGLLRTDGEFHQRLIDKFSGGAKPDQAFLDAIRSLPNSSGGMDLAEAIRETARQQAVQRSFEARKLPYETVETYFVIELPFRWLKEGSRSLPAAIYGRQAHYGRFPNLQKEMPGLTDVLIEGAPGSMQRTATNSIIDFGANLVVAEEAIPFFAPLDDVSLKGDGAPKGWAYDIADAFVSSGDRAPVEALIRRATKLIPSVTGERETQPHAALFKKIETALVAPEISTDFFVRLKQIVLEGDLPLAHRELLLARLSPGSARAFAESLNDTEREKIAKILNTPYSTQFALVDLELALLDNCPLVSRARSLILRRIAGSDHSSFHSLDPRILRALMRAYQSKAYRGNLLVDRMLLLRPDLVPHLILLAEDAEAQVREGARGMIDEALSDAVFYSITEGAAEMLRDAKSRFTPPSGTEKCVTAIGTILAH
jgi:hypothetical protein